tara:strand:+ start:1354 stop:3303 length:1950 start_codon:yes stop_codon:yes gene_type:complete
MADNKIALELTVALADSNKSLEELNALLKQAKNEMKKASDGSQDFKKLDTQIKKTEASMKKASSSTKSLGADLSGVDSLTGGLGAKFGKFRGTIGSVIKSFKSLKFAIAATGIGALALAIAAVGKAFTASEEGQNKFAKIMSVIGALTGNLLDLLADLGDKIISVFENPKQAAIDLGDAIKENLTNRVEGMLELLPALGKAIKLAMNLEFSEAGKVAADAVGKVTLGVDSITDSIGNAIDKTKEFVQEQITEGKAAAKVADMRAKAEKLERALLVEKSISQSKVAQLRLKARQEEQFSAAERKEALLEAQDLENGLLDKETKALELRKNAQILENTFSRTDKENLDKEAKARAAVNNQIAKRANVARQLQRELNTVDAQVQTEKAAIDAAEKLAAKEKEDALEAIRIAGVVSKEEKRAEEIQKETQKYVDLLSLAAIHITDKDELAATELELKAAQNERLKELQAKFLKEDKDAKDKAAKEDEDRTQKQKDIEEAALDAKFQSARDVTTLISGLADVLAQGNEEQQRKAFKLNKAASIGAAVINTAQGVSKAFAQGGVGGFVTGATVAAAGIVQINKISKTQFKGGGSVDTPAPSPTLGGGDAGTQPNVPSLNTSLNKTPTTKVIVTETDIRKATRSIDGIYNKAVVVE